MDTIRKFVQERNEALGSLDEGKIKAYMKKYGCDDISGHRYTRLDFR